MKLVSTNKGISLIKIIIALLAIDLIGIVIFAVISYTTEISKEKADLDNIRICITKIQDAFLKNEGTDPTYYLTSGPYSSTDNEKDLGTREVLKQKDEKTGVITYSMYVLATQKQNGWQIKEKISGCQIEDYDINKEMYKIYISTKDPEIKVELVDFFGNK